MQRSPAPHQLGELPVVVGEDAKKVSFVADRFMQIMSVDDVPVS